MTNLGNIDGFVMTSNPPQWNDVLVCHGCKIKKVVQRQAAPLPTFNYLNNYQLIKESSDGELKHRYPKFYGDGMDLGHSCERMRCDLNNEQYRIYIQDRMKAWESHKPYFQTELPKPKETKCAE